MSKLLYIPLALILLSPLPTPSRSPEIPPSILHAQSLRNALRSLHALCPNSERWNQLIRDLSAFPDSQVTIVLCAVDSTSRPGHLLYLYDLEAIPLRPAAPVWGATGGKSAGDKAPPAPPSKSPIHHRLIITRDELRSERTND